MSSYIRIVEGEVRIFHFVDRFSTGRFITAECNTQAKVARALDSYIISDLVLRADFKFGLTCYSILKVNNTSVVVIVLMTETNIFVFVNSYICSTGSIVKCTVDFLKSYIICKLDIREQKIACLIACSPSKCNILNCSFFFEFELNSLSALFGAGSHVSNSLTVYEHIKYEVLTRAGFKITLESVLTGSKRLVKIVRNRTSLARGYGSIYIGGCGNLSNSTKIACFCSLTNYRTIPSISVFAKAKNCVILGVILFSFFVVHLVVLNNLNSGDIKCTESFEPCSTLCAKA